MPDQRTRELSVRRKLNAMPAVFQGKSVLLVDDSIVRGTTMRQIVDMVRKAGAKKVSCSLVHCILFAADVTSLQVSTSMACKVRNNCACLGCILSEITFFQPYDGQVCLTAPPTTIICI